MTTLKVFLGFVFIVCVIAIADPQLFLSPPKWSSAAAELVVVGYLTLGLVSLFALFFGLLFEGFLSSIDARRYGLSAFGILIDAILWPFTILKIYQADGLTRWAEEKLLRKRNFRFHDLPETVCGKKMKVGSDVWVKDRERDGNPFSKNLFLPAGTMGEVISIDGTWRIGYELFVVGLRGSTKFYALVDKEAMRKGTIQFIGN